MRRSVRRPSTCHGPREGRVGCSLSPCGVLQGSEAPREVLHSLVSNVHPYHVLEQSVQPAPGTARISGAAAMRASDRHGIALNLHSHQSWSFPHSSSVLLFQATDAAYALDVNVHSNAGRLDPRKVGRATIRHAIVWRKPLYVERVLAHRGASQQLNAGQNSLIFHKTLHISAVRRVY